MVELLSPQLSFTENDFMTPETSPTKLSHLSESNIAAPEAQSPPAVDHHREELAVACPRAERLEALLTELVSPDAARRASAARDLGRNGDVAAVGPLISALKDADADVAREAAASLGLLRNAAAVEPLIAVLDNRDGYFHCVARIAAAHSLGQLGDLRAVTPLIHAIKDPIAECAAEAIRALALLPDPRSLPAFLEVVRNEFGFFLATTRHAAILGLAAIGGKQAVCELHFVASNQWEDAAIRAAAMEVTRDGSASALRE